LLFRDIAHLIDKYHSVQKALWQSSEKRIRPGWIRIEKCDAIGISPLKNVMRRGVTDVNHKMTQEQVVMWHMSII
jgi:hypothetical protein